MMGPLAFLCLPSGGASRWHTMEWSGLVRLMRAAALHPNDKWIRAHLALYFASGKLLEPRASQRQSRLSCRLAGWLRVSWLQAFCLAAKVVTGIDFGRRR